ncbi:MAG: STAS domain-containing protein [Bacteriovoracaceae bacterium]|nr:STAS domain-containing protein [Bacteriovoracaceae bacterium]
MTMKARVRTDAHGNITIHMEGDLNYENSSPLKTELETLSKENPSCQITLDMHGLDFVGSSGIGMFVDTIKALNENRERIKISNVKTEFIKVFKLYDLDLMSVIENHFDSDDTENLSQTFAGRKRTFEN